MVAILVVMTVAAFIVADWLILRRRRAVLGAEAFEAVSPESISTREGLFYSSGHTWAALEQNGALAVGIDNLICRLVGRIDMVDLPKPGRAVGLGDPLFSLRRDDLVIDIPSPVAGVVEAGNIELEESPLLLEPRLRGWAVRVRPLDISADISRMSIGRRAADWMSAELSRLRDFFHNASFQSALAEQTALDGGMPVEGALSKLDAESLRSFKEAFMRPDIG